MLYVASIRSQPRLGQTTDSRVGTPSDLVRSAKGYAPIMEVVSAGPDVSHIEVAATSAEKGPKIRPE